MLQRLGHAWRSSRIRSVSRPSRFGHGCEGTASQAATLGRKTRDTITHDQASVDVSLATVPVGSGASCAGRRCDVSTRDGGLACDVTTMGAECAVAGVETVGDGFAGLGREGLDGGHDWSRVHGQGLGARAEWIEVSCLCGRADCA